MKVTLVQMNPIVGDLENNKKKIIDNIRKHSNHDLIIFPELVLTGYPPRDKLYETAFIDQIQTKIEEIIKSTSEVQATVILGSPFLKNEKLYNSILIIENKKIVKVIHKILLPNYDVFDEERYFSSLPIHSTEDLTQQLRNNITFIKGKNIWFSVCEDLWPDLSYPSKFKIGWLPSYLTENKNQIDLMISLSASPFVKQKINDRIKMATQTVDLLQAPLIYVNQVGANDDLIFDGSSFVVNCEKRVKLQLDSFVEQTKSFELDLLLTNEPEKKNEIIKTLSTSLSSPWGEVFGALTLGIRDYFAKTGFKQAVIGLSGGVDSALVAVLAVGALGKENVDLIALPSKYNSDESLKDAEKLATNLNANFVVLPIESTLESFRKNFTDSLNEDLTSLADQNLQARMRGNFLMTYSNLTGRLLLATGNKSELAMGYSTLYGDMCGALLVIGDLLKTEVYTFCNWINQNSKYLGENCEAVIPLNILTKAPSAELKPNQKDSDSLPPYEILDPIIEKILVLGKSQEDLITDGFSKKIIDEIIQKIKINEYKRHQAPPVIKVSAKAFGSGRKIPIVKK